jgi:hypothetical protein
MTYTIQEHGDILEKKAAKLISTRFPFYERVWQTYIGNRGNESMASIPEYPNDIKRKDFAENSYTVLESAYMIERLLDTRIFENPISSFEGYIEFNTAFITVFALLGRMHDTAVKASYSLKYNNQEFQTSIKKFYEARSIIIHGKKVPLRFDEIGLLKIPILKTSFINGEAWDDKTSLWVEAENIDSEYVEDKLSNFFYPLLDLINQEYATFHNIILQELKSIPTSILFEYNTIEHANINASGITHTTGVDVYGFNRANLNRIKNK